MEGKWKAIATCGIWVGAGIACAFISHSGNPEAAGVVASSAATATVLMWLFGLIDSLIGGP